MKHLLRDRNCGGRWKRTREMEPVLLGPSNHEAGSPSNKLPFLPLKRYFIIQLITNSTFI